MNYKQFKESVLFKDADIVEIQNIKHETVEPNYKKLNKQEIIDYQLDIADDLVYVTLTMDI